MKFTSVRFLLLVVGILSLFLAANSARGQDIAIFSEATGGDAITTTDFVHEFDTTVRNDNSTYTLSSGSDIEMPFGKSLVIYNSRFDSTGGGNRTEVQTNLNLNGADLTFGWSQGYIRRSNGQDETITAGGTIIDVPVAGQVLQLQSFRTDNNGGAPAIREPGNTGIQLIKLDDAWDYLRLDASGADANQSLPGNTTTWLDIAYDTELEKDAGSFGFTASGSDITLIQQGHYLVMANTFMTGIVEREMFIQRLTLDGTEVSGSKTTVYTRGNNQNSCGDGGVSLGMIIETTGANQVLNVELLQDTGQAGSVLGNRTGITIVKLPDTADYVRLEDISDNQNINSNITLQYNDAGSQLELDTSFSHDTATNSGRVGVTVTGDYLFFAQQFDDNDGVQRGFYNQGWQTNGSGGLAIYGQTGRYTRSTGGVDRFGNWSG